jgi:deazaflavin-dependent oxidoreductase (nitroreductase family)
VTVADVGRFSLPDERPQGLNAPVTRKLIKLMSKVQVRVFMLTNGRVGRNWRIGAGFRNPVPTLLLEHVGRKSGEQYTTPLVFLEDGPDLVIVASVGGLKKNPQWYRNLVSTPETQVRLPKEGVRPVRAHVADDAERARLWPMLVDLYADFAKYQGWTDRKIPVIILEPR